MWILDARKLRLPRRNRIFTLFIRPYFSPHVFVAVLFVFNGRLDDHRDAVVWEGGKGPTEKSLGTLFVAIGGYDN